MYLSGTAYQNPARGHVAVSRGPSSLTLLGVTSDHADAAQALLDLSSSAAASHGALLPAASAFAAPGPAPMASAGSCLSAPQKADARQHQRVYNAHYPGKY